MVSEITIHLEGGGNTSATLAPFRQGMSAFLNPLVVEARKRKIRWNIVPCGGRKEAYDSFCDALRTEPESFHILLVDGEDPVTQTPWEHLRNRAGDKWEKPTAATESQCHLMIVMMETWILADRDAVKEFFGLRKGFDADALPVPRLPRPPKLATFLENMSKSNINDALANATKNMKAGRYEKIRRGAALLGRINSKIVRQQCPSCDRLFNELAATMGTQV